MRRTLAIDECSLRTPAAGPQPEIKFVRPAGALIAINIVPAALDIRSATVRERFRDAIISALDR